MIITHIAVAVAAFGFGVAGALGRLARRGMWSTFGLTILSGGALLAVVPGASLARFCGLTAVLAALVVIAELRARRAVVGSKVAHEQ